jgi:6-phosphogluconolactonase (cycloisomerase 2 family)
MCVVRARNFCAASKLLLCAVALFGTIILAAQTNAVYVQSNISSNGGNSILGFGNDGVGNLTPLPNSPYLTHGTGWGLPHGQKLGIQNDSDDQIVINAAKKLLFTVNAFSNTVSIFKINADASLTLLGNPVPSGGTMPASIGLLEGQLQNGNALMVVVNKSADPNQNNEKLPDIVSFTVTPAGVATPNLASKTNFTSGSGPSQAIVLPGNIVVIDVQAAQPSYLAVYRMRSNGTFQALSTLDAPPEETVFLGMIQSPVSHYFYVAFPEQSLIGVYNYVPSTGAVSMVTTVATTGTLPCWLAISKDGKHLYSGDTSSGTVSVFDVSDPTAPVFEQAFQLSTEVGNHTPWNVAIDPTGKFLYAITGLAVHVMNIQNDGSLAEVTTPLKLDLPPGTLPYGLATVMK